MYFARAVDGSIVDVTQVARGSACECTCLGCNTPLVAKQGRIKAWHFGHASGSTNRACGETALHHAGKALLGELKEILVPKVTFEVTALDLLDRKHEQTVQKDATYFSFTSCDLEHTTGARRLDAVLRSSDTSLLGVEILVTHKVDEQKAEDLKCLNAPVIEIDLSSWVGKPLDREILKGLLEKTAPRIVVAGVDVVLSNAIARAEIYLAQIVEDTNRKLRDMLALSPREAAARTKIAERIAIPSVPWPLWLDWRGWMQGEPIDDMPRKLFGVHHTVWQVACAEFLNSMRYGEKFNVGRVKKAVQLLLNSPWRDDDYMEHAALASFLVDHLCSLGYVKYLGNDDHGWGEDWYAARKLTTPNETSAALLSNEPNDDSQMVLF
jgi:Competence protein CoiA-like family